MALGLEFLPYAIISVGGILFAMLWSFLMASRVAPPRAKDLIVETLQEPDSREVKAVREGLVAPETEKIRSDLLSLNAQLTPLFKLGDRMEKLEAALQDRPEVPDTHELTAKLDGIQAQALSLTRKVQWISSAMAGLLGEGNTRNQLEAEAEEGIELLEAQLAAQAAGGGGVDRVEAFGDRLTKGIIRRLAKSPKWRKSHPYLSIATDELALELAAGAPVAEILEGASRVGKSKGFWPK